MSDVHLEDGVAALLHEPAGGAGGTTDANGTDVAEPGGIDFLGVFDKMAVGVHMQALVVEHLAVRTLSAAVEKDEVVLGGKTGDIGYAVGNGTADGVEALEGSFGRDMGLDVVDDTMELIERLRGLAVEVDIAGEVEFSDLVEVLDDDSRALGLSDESEHLGMTFLSEDDNLSATRLKLFLDALLELEDHGTGGIDDLDVVLTETRLLARRLSS